MINVMANVLIAGLLICFVWVFTVAVVVSGRLKRKRPSQSIHRRTKRRLKRLERKRNHILSYFNRSFVRTIMFRMNKEKKSFSFTEGERKAIDYLYDVYVKNTRSQVFIKRSADCSNTECIEPVACLTANKCMITKVK